MSSFVKRALPWAIGGLVILILGFLLAFFLLYRPMAARYHDCQAEIEEITQECNDLQGQVDRLNNQLAELAALEAENEQLEADLHLANLHVHLLSALVDITGARMSVAGGDPDSARTYLSGTAATLETLATLVDPAQQDVVASMQQRLTQALGELDNDQYAAQSDLDVLANNLIQLELAYFASP
ncbi:MAG: hypothetical protein JW900_14215 [Anaerolineae bacterium]|nr:hypothetical protein [Anaerolineae bacterium]